MAHKLNKSKMRNDIILTVALLFSLILIRVIMEITGISMSDYDTQIFFISSFICIKITYNVFSMLLDKYVRFKRNLRGM